MNAQNTHGTLYYWLAKADHPFAIAYHTARVEGKILIRKLQFRPPQRGSVKMQIHLCKQYLGQSDHPQTVVNVLQTHGGVHPSGLTYKQQEDLARLYKGIQKRALERAQRELESED